MQPLIWLPVTKRTYWTKFSRILSVAIGGPSIDCGWPWKRFPKKFWCNFLHQPPYTQPIHRCNADNPRGIIPVLQQRGQAFLESYSQIALNSSKQIKTLSVRSKERKAHSEKPHSFEINLWKKSKEKEHANHSSTYLHLFLNNLKD